MPTIRVEDEVFEGLQQLAEPFVDTPNAVIRRLLIEKQILKASPKPPKRMRPKTATDTAREGPHTLPLTPQQVFEQFLLATLAQNFDGRGDKRSVTQTVIERMVKHGYIGPADLELVATGETKAENTITWGRNALKNRGLISRASPRGIWELTAEGREAAVAINLPKLR